MSNKLLDSRAAAARCLAKISNGYSLSQQLPIFEPQVVEKDRGLYRQLCYGVLRFYPKLNGITKLLIQKPLKDKDRDVQMLVLIGIYQLSEMRIPDHAAVSTTVNATKSLKKHWAKGFVNGVLRQWQRNEQDLLTKLTVAEAQSHPQWLHDALVNAWPDQAAAIESANNQHPPMCLRVNHQHSSVKDYLQQLSANGIEASPCNFAEQGVRLTNAVSVEQLPQFSRGWVSVQDEAAQLAATLMTLTAGQRVLDACCAPGGKTCHLLELQPQLKELVGLDIDQQRLQRVEQNLERLQLKASLISGDAADPLSWWDNQPFDRILLDAPCSATGVIRRNPDIKLHRQPSDIVKLAKLQRKILDALWQTLKPNGRLVYATCSILPDENEKIVASFCEQQDDARHVVIDSQWGTARPYGRQLFPQPEGHDGFYYAVIEKKP
ncbi:MAG: 16S rRNA (cytosine(967)-C(5))-methyltransferase RsmB [Oceanicoccus sp.]